MHPVINDLTAGIGTAPTRRPAALKALASRMLAEVDGLVAQMGETYQAEVPEYTTLTLGELETQVLPMSRRVVTMFFSGVLDGRGTGRSDCQPFEESGRARLAMGVPLDSVLHAYRIAGRVTWQTVVRTVHPGEEILLGDLAGRWIGFIDHVSCLVARGYLAASHERMRQVDGRRRELLEALLSANDAADVAAVSLRFSTVLAMSYVPILVTAEGAAGRIDALLDAAPRGTLCGHRGGRVLLLAPETAPDLTALHRVAGGLVTYSEAAAPGAHLVTAVEHAEHLAEIAAAEPGGAGIFGPDDLLIEQLMLAAPRISHTLRRRVTDVLAGRDPSGTLCSTLRTYLSCGSVPETARLLVVHPNTVSYRLSRIRDLLGSDPRIPRQAAVLVLGLGLSNLAGPVASSTSGGGTGRPANGSAPGREQPLRRRHRQPVPTPGEVAPI